MDIPLALGADLTALSQALDERGVDLEVLLRRLSINCSLAVESYLGLSITLVVGNYPVNFTVLEDYLDPSEIKSSAMLPLVALGDFAPGSEMTFYAGTPGAFVDLVADITFALNLGVDVAQLDVHLTPPVHQAEATALAEMSLHNQAIGVLIDRGHSQEQARAELHRLARLEETTTTATARRLLDTAQRPPEPSAH